MVIVSPTRIVRPIQATCTPVLPCKPPTTSWGWATRLGRPFQKRAHSPRRHLQSQRRTTACRSGTLRAQSQSTSAAATIHPSRLRYDDGRSRCSYGGLRCPTLRYPSSSVTSTTTRFSPPWGCRIHSVGGRCAWFGVPLLPLSPPPPDFPRRQPDVKPWLKLVHTQVAADLERELTTGVWPEHLHRL